MPALVNNKVASLPGISELLGTTWCCLLAKKSKKARLILADVIVMKKSCPLGCYSV
jgi:hypothetical protein